MLADKLARIRESIAQAAVAAGRKPEEITLVAVAKGRPARRVRELFQLGVADIGENRVQEMRQKAEELADLPLRWHMVGHLQRNKIKYLLNRDVLLHSLDRLSLAHALQQRLEQAGTHLRCLVQVNLQEDAARQGVTPANLPAFMEEVAQLDRVRVVGLMTMAPPTTDPSTVRPLFRRLRLLAEEVGQRRLPGIAMDHLSMGMSGDFEAAIAEGATMIRIGRALFGEPD